MNSSNNSAVNDPCRIYHVMKPLIVYVERTENRSLCLKGLFSNGVISIGAYPVFLSLVHSFAADSSMKMSWSAAHCDNLCSQAFLSSGFLCAAHICVYMSEIRRKFYFSVMNKYLFF